MNSHPIDPDLRSLTVEELLDRSRGGLRAEEELINRYLELYARSDSTPHRVLKVMYRRVAEEAGTDVVSVVGMVLAERREEILRSLEDFSTLEGYEVAVGRAVRREIWKLRKRMRRGPLGGGRK